MSSSAADAAALAGRLLLAAVFLHEAAAKLTGYSAALAYMQAFGVPGHCCRLRSRSSLAAAFLFCWATIPAPLR